MAIRNEIKNILSLLEAEVNKEEVKPLNESKFGRVLGEFQNYVSKVVSALIRNNVPDSKDLNLALITQCFSNGMNSRDCAQTYIQSINSVNESKKPLKEAENIKLSGETTIQKTSTGVFIIQNYQQINLSIEELRTLYKLLGKWDVLS